MKDDYGLETLAVRAGIERTHFGEHSEALFLTSSYVFKNSAQAAARFGNQEPGNIYSRFSNPTVKTFEERGASSCTIRCWVFCAPRGLPNRTMSSQSVSNAAEARSSRST